MKKIIKIIFICFLTCFSFYYTDKIIEFTKNKDPIMIKIKEYQSLEEVPVINASLTKDTMLVGESGLIIDIDKSYEKMKKLEEFNSNLLEYTKIKPSISKKDNLDKLIEGKNTNSKTLSLVFKVDDLNILKEINYILETNEVSGTFFLDGKLIENIEVLAVKDSSGRAVFENTSEQRSPSMMIFGLKSNLYTILRKASYMESLGVELYPVPHGGEVTEEGATQVSTQQLVDYIDAHSVNIPEPEPTVEEDTLMPTVTQTGGNPNTVTVTFPDGCGDKYTCTYVKDGGRSQTVTRRSQDIVYTGNGTLTATLQEEDGTAHSFTVDIPLTNATE